MAKNKKPIDEERFCKECGQKFKTSKMLQVGRKFYCKDCAQEVLKEQSEKKHSSGTINVINQQNQTAPQEFSGGRKIVTKDFTTALILSVLLGWLGADRFYINQTGLGVLKLLTCGGWGVWWLIDIILFATKNVKYVRWE